LISIMPIPDLDQKWDLNLLGDHCWSQTLHALAAHSIAILQHHFCCLSFQSQRSS
jgi:hypothetical protein